MKSITLQNAGRLTAAVTVLCLGLAGSAQADCGIAANQFSFLPRLAVAAMPDGLSAASTTDVTTSEAAPREDGILNLLNTPIVGLWKTTFTSGGQVVDQGFDQWNSDGTEILNDDPPPQTGNVCLGVFVRSGPGTYKLKHPSWTYDESGNLTGTAIIREQVTIQAGGNTYKGTFTIDLFDLNGSHLTQFGGTIAAQRITVDF